MNIGSIFLTLLADGSKLGPQVQTEAQKAGDAGSKTLGQRLGAGLKTEGVRAFGAVASAAFGLATKGALELENATARFRAETGASAEEAAAAGKIINQVAGDERMALEAVNDIAIRVRRDLGAVGPIADQLTAKIARFARVTRQDGAGAVEDLDDIMDAWELQAEDMDGLLDKLVVSGQKFGGTIGADQKALAAMAPQLKAFNLTIDDGIALLDLFKASGLDAASIPRALNSAIQKLDGRPLEDFVAELAAIEDPGERARRAIEVFGSRAGVGLANAIKPGMDSLEDFAITAEESIGAVDDAAEVLDTTVSGRIQKFFSQVGAAVRGFGADFGSAATAVASLGTLLATLGGGKLLRGLAGITLKPLADLGVRIATFVATELAASKATTAIAGGLTTSINKVPGVASLKGGLTRVGGLMGSTIGKAMGIAAGAAFVLWMLDEIEKRRAAAAASIATIGEAVSSQIASGTTAELEQALAGLKQGIDAIVAETNRNGVITLATPEQITALEGLVAQYNAVQTELNRRAAESAAIPAAELRAAQAETAQAARDMVDEIPTAIEKNEARLRAAAEASIRKTVAGQLLHLGPDGIRAGAEASLGVAAGLRDKRAQIKAALDQLREDFKNKLGPTKEVALRIGQLFNRRLAKGLKDTDPIIKAQAEGTRALIEAQLIETVLAGGKAGEKIQRELEQKMHSKDPDVRRQAQRTKNLVDAALKDQPPTTPGEKIAQDLAGDIRNGTGLVGRAAYSLGRIIAQNLLAGVQGSGQVGGGGLTQQQQNNVDRANREGFAEGTGFVPATGLALVHRGEIVVPEPTASSIRAGDAVLAGTPATAGAGAGDTFNLFLPDAQHRDPWVVLDRLPRYAKVAKAASGETGWRAAS